MQNDKKQLGHVNQFILTNGLSEDRQSVSDLSPYSGFNAELGSDFDDNEFSYAGGRQRRTTSRSSRRPAPQQKRGGNFVKKAISYTPLGMAANYVKNLSTPEAITKSEARRQERIKQKARAQATTERIIAGTGSNDVLLQQLSQTNTPNPKTPIKTSTKIIIGVSAVAVLGVVGFILYKKFKK